MDDPNNKCDPCHELMRYLQRVFDVLIRNIKKNILMLHVYCLVFVTMQKHYLPNTDAFRD